MWSLVLWVTGSVLLLSSAAPTTPTPVPPSGDVSPDAAMTLPPDVNSNSTGAEPSDKPAGAESSPWLYVGVAVGAPLASGVLVIIVVWCVKRRKRTETVTDTKRTPPKPPPRPRSDCHSYVPILPPSSPDYHPPKPSPKSPPKPSSKPKGEPDHSYLQIISPTREDAFPWYAQAYDDVVREISAKKREADEEQMYENEGAGSPDTAPEGVGVQPGHVYENTEGNADSPRVAKGKLRGTGAVNNETRIRQTAPNKLQTRKGNANHEFEPSYENRPHSEPTYENCDQDGEGDDDAVYEEAYSVVRSLLGVGVRPNAEEVNYENMQEQPEYENTSNAAQRVSDAASETTSRGTRSDHVGPEPETYEALTGGEAEYENTRDLVPLYAKLDGNEDLSATSTT